MILKQRMVGPRFPGSPAGVYRRALVSWHFLFLFVSQLICFYSHSWLGFQANERHGMYINPVLSETLIASLLWFNSDCKKWRINYSWVTKWYAFLVYDFTFSSRV